MAETPSRQFNPTAAVLAILWPGLGHIFLGDRRRGLLIMFGVLFLFLGGLLIGGIDSIDRKQDRLWFLAQGLNGPIAFVVNEVNQRVVKTQPALQQLDTTSLGRVNEMGTLFTALAGLMNLVVILDAMHFAPASQLDKKRRQTDA